MTNHEVALLWTADVLHRLEKAWPERISLSLEQTLAATGARLPTGEQKVWCDLWRWLAQEGLVRIEPEQMEQLSGPRTSLVGDCIHLAVLTDKGLDSLQGTAKSKTRESGQAPARPKSGSWFTRRADKWLPVVKLFRNLAFRFVGWVCAAILLLNAYLFFADKAVLYWSDQEIRSSGNNPTAYFRSPVCYYYYPFRRFFVMYEQFAIRACPRTMPINAGHSMKQL